MLTKIDELIRPDHYHLGGDDECYFIGEYTAGRGFSYSTTNQLIYNLKKRIDRRDLPEWVWKVRAVRQAAALLRESLNADFPRVNSDPLYDDRLFQVLRLLGDGIDVRELIFQSEGMHDAHTAENRPGPGTLYHNYEIAESLVEPEPSVIAVVDDVLTTGAHFKAMKRILQETFSDAPIIGLFLARRVPDTE